MMNPSTGHILTDTFRCAVPQVIPGLGPADLQAHVPCLCAHLLPPLPGHQGARARASSQYQFQAIRALHR